VPRFEPADGRVVDGVGERDLLGDRNRERGALPVTSMQPISSGFN
jgi:hypothetical protein